MTYYSLLILFGFVFYPFHSLLFLEVFFFLLFLSLLFPVQRLLAFRFSRNWNSCQLSWHRMVSKVTAEFREKKNPSELRWNWQALKSPPTPFFALTNLFSPFSLSLSLSQKDAVDRHCNNLSLSLLKFTNTALVLVATLFPPSSLISSETDKYCTIFSLFPLLSPPLPPPPNILYILTCSLLRGRSNEQASFHRAATVGLGTDWDPAAGGDSCSYAPSRFCHCGWWTRNTIWLTRLEDRRHCCRHFYLPSLPSLPPPSLLTPAQQVVQRVAVFPSSARAQNPKWLDVVVFLRHRNMLGGGGGGANIAWAKAGFPQVSSGRKTRTSLAFQAPFAPLFLTHTIVISIYKMICHFLHNSNFSFFSFFFFFVVVVVVVCVKYYFSYFTRVFTPSAFSYCGICIWFLQVRTWL